MKVGVSSRCSEMNKCIIRGQMCKYMSPFLNSLLTHSECLGVNVSTHDPIQQIEKGTSIIIICEGQVKNYDTVIDFYFFLMLKTSVEE